MNNSIISLNKLSKNYKNKLVLDDINLNINAGDKIGVVGPNGSGKTTLCETIAGLRPLTTGERIVANDLIFGMQLQDAKYPRGFSGWDLIKYYLKSFPNSYTLSQVNEMIELLDASNFIDKSLYVLSGGQQQKINILLALVANPDVLILDELATGLDITTRDSVYKLLEWCLSEKPELTLIAISHNMLELKMFCKEIILMLDGKIIERTAVSKILENYSDLEAYLHDKFPHYKAAMNNLPLAMSLKKDLKNPHEKLPSKWKR